MPYEKFFSDLAQLVMQFYVGASNLSLQCKLQCDNVVQLVNFCGNIIAASDESFKDGLWRRREWQSKIAASLEILSLYAFIPAALYEKLQTSSKIKPKKKSNSETELVISEKERCQMLIELMRLLKREFQRCDKLINDWHCLVI
ncbi:phagocyte signaling-impaired protein-like [Glossina fuscipes fuscipes]